jgi:hypothetical protein
MRHYAAVSRQVRDVLHAFTPLVEPLSLDEAFLDVRGCAGLFGQAPEIARQVKGRIRAETGLTVSVGVAPNKFLAKLASDLPRNLQSLYNLFPCASRLGCAPPPGHPQGEFRCAIESSSLSWWRRPSLSRHTLTHPPRRKSRKRGRKPTRPARRWR